MNHVYHYFECNHPNMITTEEELDDGQAMGGSFWESFMMGRALQLAIVKEEEAKADNVRNNIRKHRAERRAGK